MVELEKIKASAGNFNWIFLPGGPGLGSQSLAPLTSLLELPGTIWHLDLPGDAKWQAALIEAVHSLDYPILAAHSTGGMYALATPELEEALIGLVLMDSSPDASWQNSFARYVEAHPLPEVERLQKLYAENPNNERLKQLTIAGIPYLTEGNQGFAFLEKLPYDYRAVEWSARHFDKTYQAKWIPKIPTLIFAGALDRITPPGLFGHAFQQANIMIKIIPRAGHFPWIENPEGVKSAFLDFYQFIEDYDVHQ